jgi:hypothetical protein
VSNLEFDIEDDSLSTVLLNLPLRIDFNIEYGNNNIKIYGDKNIEFIDNNNCCNLKNNIIKISSIDNIRASGFKLYFRLYLNNIIDYQILFRYGIYGILIYIENNKLLLSIISISDIILKYIIINNLECYKWYDEISIIIPDISNIIYEYDKYFYLSDFTYPVDGYIVNFRIESM